MIETDIIFMFAILFVIIITLVAKEEIRQDSEMIDRLKDSIKESNDEKSQEMIRLAGEYVHPQAIAVAYKSERDFTDKEKMTMIKNNLSNYIGNEYGYICKHPDCDYFLSSRKLSYKDHLHLQKNKVVCLDCNRCDFLYEISRVDCRE